MAVASRAMGLVGWVRARWRMRWLLVVAGAVALLVSACVPISPGPSSDSTAAPPAPGPPSPPAPTTSNDPRALTGQWSAPVNYGMSAGIMQHAVLIPGTSKILYFEDGAGTYLLDPNTGGIKAEVAGSNLFSAGQTVLADGRIMTLGGDLNGEPAAGTTNTNIYNPGTDSWTAAAAMNYLRWYPTATKLADGRILATSGTASGAVQQIPEVYSPSANTWTALPSARDYIPSYPFMFVLPDGRIVQVGSFTDPTDVQILNPANWTWSTVDPTVTDAGSAVMYLPGRILRTGTSGFPGTAAQTSSAAAYALDMNSPNPRLRQVASMANPRAFLNMTVLPDDNVLVTGGNRNHQIYDQGAGATYPAELWSPTTERWTTLASNHVPRYYHSTAILLPDGRVVVGGGWGSTATPDGRQHSYEIFSPPYLFKGPRPTITSAPGAVGYGASFTISTPDATTITRAVLIAPSAVTHNFNENARYVPLNFTAGAGVITTTAPPNGNWAPPGPYMLFLVNNNGVPSVATWINVN